jgi:hypothetical protein
VREADRRERLRRFGPLAAYPERVTRLTENQQFWFIEGASLRRCSARHWSGAILQQRADWMLRVDYWGWSLMVEK